MNVNISEQCQALFARVTAVRLVMEGHLGKDVAKMVNLCRQSAAIYVARFNQGGLDHLLDRRLPPGRVPFLTEEQQQEIRQLVLTTTPVDAGWGIASSWNTRILQSYIQHTYGVSMSREGIRKLLHRLRLSWTRPTYKLVKGDAKRQAAFQKELEFIKKKLITENVTLFYVGETHVRAYQALRTTWAEAGNQKQVPSYGHHAHVSIFGAVDVQQGDVVFHRASSANAETFLDFLRRLKEKYADQFLVFVLDNARIHHAKMVQAFLDGGEGAAFHFIFLPPYSPQLNPIERLWKWLKDEVIANVFTRIKTTLPNPLLALNSTFYNTRMRCCAASGVLREPEVKILNWMYIEDFYTFHLQTK